MLDSIYQDGLRYDCQPDYERLRSLTVAAPVWSIALTRAATVRERRVCVSHQNEPLRYRGSTGAGILSFGNRGIISSRFATYHTADAISAAAFFTSSGTMRS